MTTTNPDDLFAVNRDDVTYSVEQQSIMASLQDNDYLAVNRNNVTYKITGKDFIASVVDDLSLNPIVTPTVPFTGETLVVDSNVSGGKSPYTYTYQWKYKETLAGVVSDYVGATSTTYVTNNVDEGRYIACEVTVVDGLSSTVTELSNFTDIVTKPATVVKPKIVAPADNAGEMVTAVSDVITRSVLTSLASNVTVYQNSGNGSTGVNGSGSVLGTQGDIWNAIEVEGSQVITFDIASYENSSTRMDFLLWESSDNGVTYTRSYSAATGGTKTVGSNTNYIKISAYSVDPSVGDNSEACVLKYAAVDTTTLTLAGNKDLTVFQTLDDIQMDTAGAPETSAITNVGTAPWPLWENAALLWNVSGTKTSDSSGGDVITSALPTGSLLYTEFTIAATAVTRRLGVQFTATPNSTSANQGIVGWYFNGTGGSKAVWTAGGDSNSSMGAGMGGNGQVLFTKADFDAAVSSGSTYGSGDVLGYAIDAAGRVWVSLNGDYLATDDWYIAGNGAPVPGVSGYVATITGTTRYFAASYNGGQTFTMNNTATYPPLQTLLTLTDDTNLANFRVGDVVGTGLATQAVTLAPGDPDYFYAPNSPFSYYDIKKPGTYTDTFYVKEAGTLILNVMGNVNAPGQITFYVTTDNCTCSQGSAFTIPAGLDLDPEFVFAGAGSFTITYTNTTSAGNGRYYLDYGVSNSYWTPLGGNQVVLSATNLGIGTEISVTDISPSTPSITTDGGSWHGINGNVVTGDPTGERFVTGPSLTATGTISLVNVLAKTITLSSSNGRWLETHDNYQEDKKLNKFVIGEETLSQDAVVDISGEVERQIETDEITEVITTDTNYSSVCSSVGRLKAGAFPNAFDGIVNTDYANNSVSADATTVSWEFPCDLTGKDFKSIGGTTTDVEVELTLSDSSVLSSVNCYDVSKTYQDSVSQNNTMFEWNIEGKNIKKVKVLWKASNAYIFGFLLDDVFLGPPSTTLTLSGNKDLSGDSSFVAGDAVEQDSGHTPTTSAITNVDDNTLPDLGASGNWINTSADSGALLFSLEPIGTSTKTYVYGPTTSTPTWTAPPNGKLKGSGSVFLGWQSKYTGSTEYLGTICRITTQNGTFDSAGQIYNTVTEVVLGNNYEIEKIEFIHKAGNMYNGGLSWISPTANETDKWVSGQNITSLTFNPAADNTDLANFRVGDAITQDNAAFVDGTAVLIQDSTRSIVPISYNESTNIPDGTTPFPGQTVPGKISLGEWGVNFTGTDNGTVPTGPRVQLWTSPDGFSWNKHGSFGLTEHRDDWANWFNEKYFSLSCYDATQANGTDVGSFPGGQFGPKGIISSINSATNTITLSSSVGTWSANTGNFGLGPALDPATGVFASTNGINTMTLSDSDETYPKRWIVNQGKTVLGPIKKLAGIFKIYSSEFKSDPRNVLTHSTSDWQIALKTETGKDADGKYLTVIDEGIFDGTNLESWPPTGLEENTAYRCHVRHRSGDITSEWSDESTFKTAENTDDKEISAVPGNLCVYNVQNVPTSFTTSSKFINWTCGRNYIGVGEDGNIYRGPAHDQTTGAFAIDSLLTTFLTDKDEVPLDIYAAYAAYPDNTNTHYILCKSGNVYFSLNDTVQLTNVKKMIKLGGVKDMCMFQTHDDKFFVSNISTNDYLQFGDMVVTSLETKEVVIGLPPDDNKIKGLTAVTGSKDARSCMVVTENNNLYYFGWEIPRNTEVGLSTAAVPNNAPVLLSGVNWDLIQGKVENIGGWAQVYSGASTSAAPMAGVWFKTVDHELYVINYANHSAAVTASGPDGPVKVLDNALTGAISVYTSEYWFAIDRDGYAWDATKSRTLTRNDTAGAIFASQGSGHASHNFAVKACFVILDN